MKQPRKTIGSSVRIKKVETAPARPTIVDTKIVALEKISLHKENRLRVKEDVKTIDRYAEVWSQYLEDKKKDRSVQCPFEAVHLFREKGRYCLTDGWLRYRAAQKAGVTKIACVVHTDKTTAMRAGMQSNQRHGLPLNDKDKTHCIKRAVPAMKDLSNRMIADLVGCSPSLVDKVVKQYQLRTSTQLTTGKDGKKRSVPKKNRKKPLAGWKQFWLRCVKRTPGLSFLGMLVGGCLARIFGKRKRKGA
jgi:hypothetical protein